MNPHVDLLLPVPIGKGRISSQDCVATAPKDQVLPVAALAEFHRERVILIPGNLVGERHLPGVCQVTEDEPVLHLFRVRAFQRIGKPERHGLRISLGKPRLSGRIVSCKEHHLVDTDGQFSRSQ